MAGLQRDAGTIIGTGDPDGRTRDQVTADLLVERVTGQCTAAAVPIELHLVMTDRALFGPGEDPAWLPGHGPMPAEAARRMLADPEGEVFLRRLFTRPEDGQLVGMDSRARVVPPLLRRMIVLRDDVCRTPWCDAPIRHADHISPHAAGGATSLANGQGLCAACNYAKETPGWRHRTREDGGGQVTTPELPVINGFGAYMAAEVSRQDGGVRVVAHGVPDRYIEQASRVRQLAQCGLDAAGIADRVRALHDAEALAG